MEYTTHHDEKPSIPLEVESQFSSLDTDALGYKDKDQGGESILGH